MRKDEILMFHAMLYQLRRTFEAEGWVVGDEFAAYNKLGVTPLALVRDRRSHEMACFLLGEALSAIAVKRCKNGELKHSIQFIHHPRGLVL